MAEQMTDIAEEFMDDVSDEVEANVDSLKRKAGDVACDVTDRMGHAAAYLRNHSPADMLNDVETLVKRYPAQSLIAATCVGFLVAYSLRRDD